MTRPVSKSRLCLLVFLLGIVGLALSSLWVPAEAEPRTETASAEPDAPAIATIPACRDPSGPERPVIQPGREVAMLDWIAPLREGGVGGLSVHGVSLASDHLQIRLEGDVAGECALPRWSGTAGVLAIGCGGLDLEGLPPPEGQAQHGDFVSAWWRCDRSTPFDGQQSLESLAARYDGDIWGTTLDASVPTSESPSSAVPEGWDVSEPVSVSSQGILGPAAQALGSSPSAVMQWTFVLGALVSLVAFIVLGDASTPPAASSDADPPSSRRQPLITLLVLVAVVLAAVALRGWLGSSAVLDSDEDVWGRASQLPVFADDHDAWVHPPLYRLLQHRWSAFAFDRAASSIAWLRGPSMVASMIAAATVAALAWFRGSKPVGLLVLGLCVGSPVLAEAGVIARPYGLASMLFAVVLLALHGREDRPSWPSATLAAGLVLWCDLLYGAAALLLVVLELVRRQRSREHRSWPTMAWVAFALGLWSAPLLPGALHPARADSTLIHSGDRASEDNPDLRPEDPMTTRAATVASFAGWDLGAPVGLASAVGLVALCIARRRSEPALLLGVACLAAGAAAAVVELRPRNILFVPLATTAAWLVLLDSQLRPRDRPIDAKPEPKPTDADEAY
ncbi:MAG: hypothetical protein AAF799_22205 [Myxococcota bacterium]